MFPADKTLPQEPFALLPVLPCDMYTVHFRMSVGMASFLLFYYGNDVYNFWVERRACIIIFS